MTNNMDPTATKKSIPTWAKVLIVLVILGFGMITLIGIGLNFLGSYLSDGGAQKLIEKGIETAIEKGIENSQDAELKKLAQDINVDLSDKGFVVKNDQTGEEFSIKADNKIPESFAKDIPIFTPSSVLTTMNMGALEMVTLETTSSIDDVAAFYKSKLAEGGWQSPFTGSFAAGTFSSLFNKGERQLTVSIQTENAKTVIVLSSSKMPQ